MYDELVKQLREVEEMLKVAQFTDAANLIVQTADTIEELSKKKDCPYWFEDGGFCSMLGKCVVEPPKEET